MANYRRDLIITGLGGLMGLFVSKLFAKGKGGKREIKTDKAPAAIGPYSQAIRAGDFLFVSGQIGIDPSTGKLKEGVEAQAVQVLENIKAILEAAGAGMDSVVKATVYLKDMNNYAKVNEIYSRYFKPPYPARAAVQVARLPKDVEVEIEVIAYLGD